MYYAYYMNKCQNKTKIFINPRFIFSFFANIVGRVEGLKESLKVWKKLKYNPWINVLVIYIYSILAKLSTWCFEHSGDISCSLLVNPSHTDESWAGRNTCMWIYIYTYIYIYIYICIYIYKLYLYYIYILHNKVLTHQK